MNKILADILLRFSSRKFLAVVGLILLLLADNVGLQLDPQIRTQLVVLVLAYIAAEGTADAISRANG